MLKFIPFALAVLFLSGCCKTLDVNGTEYRTAGAFRADLGSYGLKRTKGCNQYDPKGVPHYENKLQVKVQTEIYSKEARSLATKVAAAEDVTNSELNLELDVSDSKTGRYVVTSITSPMDVVEQLNDPSNAKILAYVSASDRARIITSVAVAFDYEEVVDVTTGGSAKFPVKQVGADLDLAVSVSKDKTLRISDGTIFAYESSRFIWRKNGDKIEVFDLVPDRPGWDKEVPEGMSTDPTSFH